LRACLHPGLHRAPASHPQHADHLDLGVPALRGAAGATGLDRASGGLGVQRIGLAVAAASRPVGTVHLDDGQAVVGQEAQQPGTEVAGTFHTHFVDLAERLDPGRQLGIAAHRGREALRPQQSAGLIEHRRHMHVGVGVHAYGHHRFVVHTPVLSARR
jgi:hypothetical protein